MALSRPEPQRHILEGKGTCRGYELNHCLKHRLGVVFLGSLRAKEGSGESQWAAALNSNSCSIPSVHITFQSRPQNHAGDRHRPFFGPGFLPAQGGPVILTIITHSLPFACQRFSQRVA